MRTRIDAWRENSDGELKSEIKLRGKTYELVLLTAEITEKLAAQLDTRPEVFAMRLAEFFIEEKN